MYLFFDKNGTLLEIVNDSALRQYNQDANKMYVYIQDEDGSISGKIAPSIVGLTHRYKKSNGEIVNGTQILRPSDGTKYKDGVFEYKEIPFNRKRDLKHFSYGRKYEFFVVDVPSGTITPVDYEDDGTKTVEYVTEGTVFDVAGTVLATLTTICDEQTSLVLERFAFAVEESVPAADGALSGSQFAWLIGEIIRMGNRIDGYYDYDKQNNRPIVNVDMDSPDFIAKASNYYRHIGENSAEHRNGLIYYCPEDGTLVEIDGGTSLNLNGQYTEEATVYAPTNGGDNTGVKVLVPHGDGEEPTWERLSVSSSGSVTSAGVTYSIELGGNSVGTITLPKETYIEDITFNGSTKIVTFKYNGESGRGEKTVDLSKLVDVYTAGNGLQKSGNEFSIKTNSSYLSTSSQGLSVNASSIAGLAQIYLNGSRKAANSNQFYAPTTYHTSNSNSSCWVLVPKGINTAPVWERIYVEKSGLTYTLKLGNYMIGKIELIQEIYLDDVKYNSDTNKLVFTYNTASGQSAIEVDLTDLVDMYDAGLGLEKVGNKFNVKIAPNSEKYLKATAEGLVFDESALPIGGGGGTATGNGGTFIAKTEDEMTALLKPENVGALVSYMGEGGGAAVGTPFAVGDTIDTLYFNTSVEPDLSALTYEEGFASLIERESSSDAAYILFAVDLSFVTEGQYQGYYMAVQDDINGEPYLVYCTDNLADMGLSQGWQNLDVNGAISISNETIATVNQQDLWSSYISKEPFAAGGGAYKKDSVYLVTEFKPKHSDIKTGDTIDKLHFNTDVTPDFSGFSYNDGGVALIDGGDGFSGLLAYDIEHLMGDASYAGKYALSYRYNLGNDNTGEYFIYANADLTEDVGIGEGWNSEYIVDGVLTLPTSLTIASVNQQDLWSSYISKEPFATEITTKKIDCESNLIVAKSETEFNNALVVDNIGKLISYNDELFVIAADGGSGAPIAVGDTIDKIYFDTNATPDLATILNGESTLNILTTDSGGIKIYDYTSNIEGLYLINWGSFTVYASVDCEPLSLSAGWNTTTVDNGDIAWDGSAITFSSNRTVDTVVSQDLWSSYISKEPFGAGTGGGIIAKPVNEAPIDYVDAELVDELSYNDLNDVPIVIGDLDAITPVANTYYKHNGASETTYTKGVIYFYDGSTFAPVTGGGGGGVSDVQINGTSIVSNGVANIPAADESTSGIVTTGQQTFSGVKRFSSWPQSVAYQFHANNDYNNLGGFIKGLNSGMRFSPLKTNSLASFTFVGDPVDDNKSGCFAISPGTSKISHKLSGSSSATYDSTFPPYTGTLLSASSTWSTGTSGSVTLPSAGLYEVKFNVVADDGQTFVVHAILYWDGSSPTSEERKRIVATAGTTGEVGVWVRQIGDISATSYTTGYTIVNNEVSYRKIGIA